MQLSEKAARLSRSVGRRFYSRKLNLEAALSNGLMIPGCSGKAARMTESSKEYADSLKRGIKGLVDDIDTDTEIGQRIMTLIHGFTYSGYLECLKRKAVRHE